MSFFAAELYLIIFITDWSSESNWPKKTCRRFRAVSLPPRQKPGRDHHCSTPMLTKCRK